MELRHLKYFVAVAEELHFGKAANKVHISQPPLSQQIRQLETELGTKLLHRTKRRVELTHSGRLFLQDARATLARADEAIARVKRAQRGEVGHLSIGWLPWSDFTALPSMVGKFCERYSDVHLDMHYLAAPELMSALHAGRIDVGFLLQPFDTAALRTELVVRHPLVVALPKTNKLSAMRQIRFSDLANERYILFKRDSSPGFYDYVISLCQREGVTLNVRHEASHTLTVLALVAAGLGVTLLPFGGDYARSGVTFRRLVPPPPFFEVALAWRQQNESPLLKRFIETIRQNRQTKLAPGALRQELKKATKR
jgi:DNA-binding transcriptional LysR family regulator